MDEMVYLNGSVIPRAQAKIPVMDYGFLHGYGLFETARAYRGRVFRLDRHLARLAQSARFLGIPVDRDELANAVTSVIRANNLSDARVRITVSAGEGELAPDPASCTGPTVLVMATEYRPYPEGAYEQGFRAVVSSLRRNSRSPLAGLKSTSHIESLLARQEAKRAGADEAICLNEKGLLAEASASNIFLVTGDTLRTPGLDSGILPGVTREAVLELARELGITATEGDTGLDELLGADEAFLTGSVMEVMPLVVVGDQPIGDGRPGKATRRLREEYRRLVERELGGR